MSGVLVAIDPSADAKLVEASVGWAIKEGEKAGLPVTVLAVCLTPYAMPGVSDMHPEPDEVTKAREHAEQALDAVVRSRGRLPEVPVTVEVDYGSAADRILERARDADLVVLGAHGSGRVAMPVIGSVLGKVLRHAATPVTVIPRPSAMSSQPSALEEARL